MMQYLFRCNFLSGESRHDDQIARFSRQCRMTQRIGTRPRRVSKISYKIHEYPYYSLTILPFNLLYISYINSHLNFYIQCLNVNKPEVTKPISRTQIPLKNQSNTPVKPLTTTSMTLNNPVTTPRRERIPETVYPFFNLCFKKTCVF